MISFLFKVIMVPFDSVLGVHHTVVSLQSVQCPSVRLVLWYANYDLIHIFLSW